MLDFSKQYNKNAQNAQNNLNREDINLRYRFCQLFNYNPWDFLEKASPEAEWTTVKKYFLNEQKLWERLTNSPKILGVRFRDGQNATYGMFDLDVEGEFHPSSRQGKEKIRALQHSLEQYGITRTFPVQSSWSEGIHLYFFLPEKIHTYQLATLLLKAVIDVGLNISPGNLESFPNCKNYKEKGKGYSLYNGHRLPLQQGSFLLDEEYNPISNSLADFVEAAEWSIEGVDFELLTSKLPECYEWYKKEYKPRLYGYAQQADEDFKEETKERLKQIEEGFFGAPRIAVERGFDGYHQTNELILSIATYGVKNKGIQNQKILAEYIYQTITNCKGYEEYCRHQHNIHCRAEEAAKWGLKNWSRYKSYPQNKSTYCQAIAALDLISKEKQDNLIDLNEKRKEKARKEISKAVEVLKRSRNIPQTIAKLVQLIQSTVKDLFGSKTSKETLYKDYNLDLWHPKHHSYHQENLESEPTVSTKCPTPPNLSPEQKLLPPAREVHQSPAQKLLLPAKEVGNPMKKQLQKMLQLELSSRKEYKIYPTPAVVTQLIPEKSETLESSQDKDSSSLSYTLPYMKGCVGGVEEGSGASSSSLGEKTSSELTYLVIETVRRIYQYLYAYYLIKYTKKQNFKLKLENQWFASGLVQLADEKFSKMEVIPEKTTVELTKDQTDLIFYLERLPRQILIYIKPLSNQNWLNGVPINLKFLNLVD